MDYIKNLVLISFDGDSLFQSHLGSLFAQDLEKLISSTTHLDISPGQRQKILASTGHIFLTNMEGKCFIAVCCISAYPQRHAFGLVKRIQRELSSLTRADIERGKTDKFRRSIVDSMKEFDDLKNIDKAHMADAKLQDIKIGLSNDMNRIINNQGSLQGLQSKAQQMKGNAELFKNQSKDLQRIMYWRNCKVTLLIIFLVVGILGFTIFAIVSKFTNNDNNKSI